MNKRPVLYMQTDPRWKDLPYSTAQEKATIGGSGCGPTCAAMLLSTLTGSEITPIHTCAWAVAKGYKATNQGTYYSYFVPQFKINNIDCEQLTPSRIINQPDNPIHDVAFQKLKDGYYLIALMGPGLWTSSGHFVVVWEEGDVVHIQDPASLNVERIRGDIKRFRNECRMYWAIDAREHNNTKEENHLTGEEIFNRLTEYLNSKETSDYAKQSSVKGIESGFFVDGDGDGLVDDPKGFLTREQLAVVLDRAGLLDKK